MASRLADVPEIRISSCKVSPSLLTSQLVKPRSATSSQLPEFVERMKAKLVGSMPSGNWIYEIKFDGYRALAMRGGNETRILSRNQKDLGSKFPEAMNSIAALDVQDAKLTAKLSRWTKKVGRPFSYSKASTWVRRDRPSFSTRLIFSVSTARIPDFTKRRTKGEVGRPAEKAARCNSVFGLVHKRRTRASQLRSGTRT